MKKITSRLLSLLLTVALLFACVPVTAVSAGGTAPATAPPTSNTTPDEAQCAAAFGLAEWELEQMMDEIFTALHNMEPMVDLSHYEIPYNEQVRELLGNLIWDTDPTLFHLETWVYHYDGNSMLTDLRNIRYIYNKTTYQRMLAACEAAAYELTADLVNSDLKKDIKALLLHDRLAVWVEYDKANLQANTVPDIDHTMYGALVNRVAVCDGYAEAYVYLLDKVGVESDVVRSEQLNHAWNIVQIGGKYYHVDVTWDDPTWDITGRVNHDNFLLSSAALYANGHTATDYDVTPQDTYYEAKTWPWSDSTSAFQYLYGDLYYINNDNEAPHIWQWDLDENTLYKHVNVSDVWYTDRGSYWTKNYSRLSADESMLYFSKSKGVYRYDPITRTTENFHFPRGAQTAGWNIFGMRIEHDLVYTDIYHTPNFDAVAKSHQDVARYRETAIRAVEVAQEPFKKKVPFGEELDLSGLVLRVRYSSGGIDYITEGYAVSGYDPNAAGQQTLTITYQGFTNYITVTVKGPILLGDADGVDGITSTDARLVLQYCVGKIKAEDLYLEAADVDGNGEVTSTDARLILQYCVGKIKNWP